LLTRNADDALRHGAAIIIEPHNHGRRWMPQEQILDHGVVTRRHFADFWVKLSRAFRDHPGVWGYNLVNEPHDMGAASWKQISQHVVDAIRADGDAKTIVVPGDGWANATKWEAANGPEDWILDPANNLIYEAHLYFDPDFSGAYRDPYAADPEIGIRRVRPFLEWCRRNNVRGILGEYGVPRDPRWCEALDRFLGELDRHDWPGIYWAAGEWWGAYPLSVHPAAGGSIPPQLDVLERHLLPRPDVFVCAAPSSRGLSIAPGSLAHALSERITPDSSIDIAAVTAVNTYAAEGHLNFVVPEGTPEGMQPVRVWRGAETLSEGRVHVDRVAPALFSYAREDGDRVILHGTGVRHAQGAITFGTRAVRNVRPHAAWPGVDELEIIRPPQGVLTALRAEGRSSNAISL
jgi:hypothetical protein